MHSTSDLVDASRPLKTNTDVGFKELISEPMRDPLIDNERKLENSFGYLLCEAIQSYVQDINEEIAPFRKFSVEQVKHFCFVAAGDMRTG
jgi:hypothetical protein